MGKLRDRMRDDLRLANYPESTIKAYLLCARKFIAHFMRSPENVTRDEVREYLLHLPARQRRTNVVTSDVSVTAAARRRACRVAWGEAHRGDSPIAHATRDALAPGGAT